MSNQEQVEFTSQMLLGAATEAGMSLSGDRRVSEADAALLLSLSAGHLKAMRQEGRGPPCYARGMNGGRVSYRLIDLAAWIEAGREDF